ncbi:glycosyltransferase [Mitsuaria sp. WAJ17]|uniref:glycosyltransferase n=1 Tax=unclassified Roseateles TaxID=2626991 RepID=UPI0016017126|nr:glycosyltransferase [Mitsuaria sp. WAJ17]MBB2485166.1 glycosyltransferase [Mitsuaria sp. WAJ17]
MRVLKLTPFFHHPDVKAWPASFDAVGGMQIQTWRQAAQLAERGVHQDVMTIGFPGLPRRRCLQTNLWVERQLAPIPHIRSEFSGLVGLTEAWAVATLLRLWRQRRQHTWDLIHAHFDGQIPALLVAWLAPRLLRRPLLVTVHCSRLAVYAPHGWLDRIQHGVARWLERRVVAQAERVMALTQTTAAVLSQWSERVEVMPDVVDTQQFAPPPEAAVRDFRQRHRLPERVVGFVGRLAKEKGWTHLAPLAAALQAQGYHLLVVGDGPQRDRLQQALVDAGVADNVTITGFIPNDEVPQAMAACRLLVMPSVYEEFGGASIEALATGVPVVAFAVGGLREILGAVTPGLLVPPQDTQALIQRVQEVLAGRHREDLQADRLRSHVLGRFSPDVLAERTLQLYRRACRPEPAHAA